MRCNLDARGKAARLIIGFFTLGIAALLAALILLGVLPGGWVWAAVVGTSLGGALALFEGRTGWCALRAMGWRTPV
ncbi:MAG: hypothetical protein GVY24_07250 [Planctomycetes bacterium]|jgi:hypothetical protein|nr:hypothetical protein [Planctomycetota bacterium]